MSTRVVVRGAKLFRPPILDTDEARIIEFYDYNGHLVALMGKIFSEDFWAFSTKNDNDWNEVLLRAGYLGKTRYESIPVEIIGAPS